MHCNVYRQPALCVTLNHDKCQFSISKTKFVGHFISKDGTQADPDKYLGKFLPDFAVIAKPLRTLLRKDIEWKWTPVQNDAFNRIKQLCTTSPVLGCYDCNAETVVCSDACSEGLGATLLQKVNDAWRPVFYASRSLTDTEKKNTRQLRKRG